MYLWFPSWKKKYFKNWEKFDNIFREKLKPERLGFTGEKSIYLLDVYANADSI